MRPLGVGLWPVLCTSWDAEVRRYGPVFVAQAWDRDERRVQDRPGLGLPGL